MAGGPRTAVVWMVLRRELAAAGRPLTVVDVGGGTGGFAVPIARAGHHVTVVDASPEAAAVLARALGGHFDVAGMLLRDPDGSAGPRDTLRRRYDAAGATALLRAAGLTLEQIHGVRVIADLLPGAVLEGQGDALVAFELAASAISPYRDVATQLHLFARKPA